MGLPFRIVQFDPTKHQNFCFNAFHARIYDWPYGSPDRPAGIQQDAQPWLRKQAVDTSMLNTRGCLVAVADDDPDCFFGFVFTMPGEVVMAYTKDALRGPGNFDAPVGTPRKLPGVCTTLLGAAGIDITKPTPVRVWSSAASRIAARGYPIYPSIARR